MKFWHTLAADELWEKGLSEGNPGFLLDAVCKALKITNSNIASALGVHNTAISHWKKKRSIPEAYHKKLIDYLSASNDLQNWFDAEKQKIFKEKWNIAYGIDAAASGQKQDFDTKDDIGVLIRRRRMQAGLTAEQFCECLTPYGVNLLPATLLGIEKGKWGAAKHLETFDLVFTALGINAKPLHIIRSEHYSEEYGKAHTFGHAFSILVKRFKKDQRTAAHDIAKIESELTGVEREYSEYTISDWSLGRNEKNFPTRLAQLEAIIQSAKEWDLEESDSKNCELWFTEGREKHLKDLWQKSLLKRREEKLDVSTRVFEDGSDNGPIFGEIDYTRMAERVWQESHGIGGKIKAIRISLGLRQKSLANVLSVSQSTMSDWEAYQEETRKKEHTLLIPQHKLDRIISLARKKAPAWMTKDKLSLLKTLWSHAKQGLDHEMLKQCAHDIFDYYKNAGIPYSYSSLAYDVNRIIAAYSKDRVSYASDDIEGVIEGRNIPSDVLVKALVRMHAQKFPDMHLPMALKEIGETAGVAF